MVRETGLTAFSSNSKRFLGMAEDTGRRAPRGYLGPPATLGSTLTAGARIVVTCRRCGHEAEAHLKRHILRHGAELSLPEWGARLVCSQCDSRRIDFMVRPGPADSGGLRRA